MKITNERIILKILLHLQEFKEVPASQETLSVADAVPSLVAFLDLEK